MASRAGQIELRNGGGSDALTHGVLERRFAQGATTHLPQSPENRRLGGPRVRISFPPALSPLRTMPLPAIEPGCGELRPSIIRHAPVVPNLPTPHGEREHEKLRPVCK